MVEFNGKTIKIKDMTPDEKREYYKEVHRRFRARSREIQGDKAYVDNENLKRKIRYHEAKIRKLKDEKENLSMK
jgi:hypothetical protein